jgi:hypothetical protein
MFIKEERTKDKEHLIVIKEELSKIKEERM